MAYSRPNPEEVDVVEKSPRNSLLVLLVLAVTFSLTIVFALKNANAAPQHVDHIERCFTLMQVDFRLLQDGYNMDRTIVGEEQARELARLVNNLPRKKTLYRPDWAVVAWRRFGDVKVVLMLGDCFIASATFGVGHDADSVMDALNGVVAM